MKKISLNLNIKEETLITLIERSGLISKSIEETLDEIVKIENEIYIEKNKEFPICEFCNKKIDPMAQRQYEIKIGIALNRSGWTYSDEDFSFHCIGQKLHYMESKIS